jgi:hypothetical protein
MSYVNKWPTQDCSSISDSYGDKLQEFAYYEWQSLTTTEDGVLFGCLQCFCISELENGTGDRTTLYGAGDHDEFEQEPICQIYIDE